MGRNRALVATSVLYGIGLVLHTADHLRRGLDSVTPQVLWLGTLSSVAAVAAIVCVAGGYRHAALVATSVGLPVALGVSAVHLLPEWGVLSDPLLTGGLPFVTWVAVLVEIAGAAAFGLAGAFAMRKLRSPDGRVGW